MLAYLVRRLLLVPPIVLGVMVITFVLFNVVNKPEAMARRILGPKAPPQVVENWLRHRGYDKPVFINLRKGANPFDAQFFHQVSAMARFDLGRSDATGEPVAKLFLRGMLPSLMLTGPAFVLGFLCAVCAALYLVYVRETGFDFAGTLVCVVAMSIPIMVYVIFGQWLMATKLKYFPAFGFDPSALGMARFLALPVCIMALAGLGADTRLYRAIFLEEAGNDYVRTAQAKGNPPHRVLLVHVFKNGLINVITLTVAALPFLIMGSLIIEDFFGIPGLGNLAISAIRSSDFAVVRATVYVGALLYLAGLILTDICYALVDPRIQLK